MTGNSLAKLSLAQRMSADTTRRPTVRLIARNNSVPMTAKLTERTSTVPDEAMPKAMAMMIQPLVSSRMAEATMIWPMSRRMKFISRTTTATILIEEIDSAVARNSAVTRRALALGRIESGSISPSANPQMKGSVTPAAATVIADRPTRRTRRKSVSMPVSSSRSRMPSCETAATMLFCSAVCGNSMCCRSGAMRPSTDGPSSSPPSNCPITAGWPNLCISSPRARPTSSSKPSSAKKIASDLPESCCCAAKAIEVAPISMADTSSAWRATTARAAAHLVCLRSRPGGNRALRGCRRAGTERAACARQSTRGKFRRSTPAMRPPIGS